jgi:hypothetical protein
MYLSLYSSADAGSTQSSGKNATSVPLKKEIVVLFTVALISRIFLKYSIPRTRDGVAT